VSYLRRFAPVTAALLGSLVLLASAGAEPTPAADPSVEVVVTLPQAPLARAIATDRTLAAAITSHHRLNLRAPASVGYLRTLASAQRTLQARIATAIPQSHIRWHYSVVVDGLAVSLPGSQLHRLSTIPGATVWPSVTYHEQLDRTPKLIGAPTVWGPTQATAGNGIKIGILDDGLDQSHVFFSPANFSYPAGFPKGQTAYTTPKVIVARTFSPASNHWRYANTPFDPVNSDHATNVAGIAAGDYNTLASVDGARPRVSGIAPNAYLGNYKVLTVPTSEFGLDGNSPEIAAGIEQAVKDGMDIINLSIGEPEIEPSRDIVVAALNGAADAGVVPVVAAGNDFGEAGKGSVSSPGTAADAITVAASTEGDSGPADVIAGFSSAGPTPISLQLKPDVTAPGVDILSSLPRNAWSNHDWSGTSMASPHVAGAAAVLKQRHPTWTVAQIKSALESTGDPVHPGGGAGEVTTLREGGGRIDLPRADNPLLFTSPTGLSFGLVRRGTTTTRELTLTDAGGGGAPWTATVVSQAAPPGVELALSTPTAAAGSTLGVTLTVSPQAAEGDATGFIVLTRGTDVRRVPYWLHVEVPKLATEKHRTIARAGTYGGTTRGGASRVSSYRYPEGGLACNCKTGVLLNLSGPEQVFRITVKNRIANVGAVIVSRASGVHVSPRLVVAGDENRLTGYDGLPVNLNPYQDYGRVEPVVAAIAPAPGAYDLVFDTPAGTKPGAFTFHVWFDDTTPPTVRLLTHTTLPGHPVKLALTDAGSGVDLGSIDAKIDGRVQALAYSHGVLQLSSRIALRPGTHRIHLVVSDYEEAKNMENVGPILPNTRTFDGTFVVR
jgi:subtilisin family serine protease